MAEDPLHRLAGRHREMEGALDQPTERLERLLEPFEAAEREDIIGGALARLARDSDEPPQDDSASFEEGSSAAEEAVVVPIERRGRSRARTILAAALSMAAALLLWLLIAPGAGDGVDASLPRYAATQLSGGSSTVRSSDDGATEPIQLTIDDRIEWVFTPEAPVRDRVAVAIIAEGPEDVELFRHIAGAEASPEGVIRIRGVLSAAVPLSPGPWHLTVVISQDATPATSKEALGPGSRVVEFDVIVQSP